MKAIETLNEVTQSAFEMYGKVVYAVLIGLTKEQADEIRTIKISKDHKDVLDSYSVIIPLKFSEESPIINVYLMGSEVFKIEVHE